MPIHRRSRLGLSYLPQEASIFRKLTVAENIRAVLELQLGSDGHPLEKAEIERRLNGLLQDLRVESLYDSPAMALSGGERRRVEIAHLKRAGDQIDRAANRLAIALVIAALIIGSSIVMTVGGGPTLFGLPAFGLLGFVGAVTGGLWLLRAIRRAERDRRPDD